MSDVDLVRWRRALRHGELPSDLVALLHDAARRMSRRRVLPPSFSPYGHWNDEAADELFAAWYSDRLLGTGQLLALLDHASSVAGLRALAQRSLRQHVLNAADRSQARNLFGRVVASLRDSPSFQLVSAAARPAQAWYAAAACADVPLWSGPERLLVAHGWAVGDIAIIRYRAGAAKLSPLLDAAELERFILELMQRVQAALTPTLIMSVLAARLDLGAPEVGDLDDAPELVDAGRGPDVDAGLKETARSILTGFTDRQREVLARSEDPVASIAAALHCSVGTVVNERRRIAAAVARLTEDETEAGLVLNIVADLLYLTNDE
jgi:hypothetical protein